MINKLRRPDRASDDWLLVSVLASSSTSREARVRQASWRHQGRNDLSMPGSCLG